MDFQITIVTAIIIAALGYIGLRLWQKMKSFSNKNSCGADCGCGETKKSKIIEL